MKRKQRILGLVCILLSASMIAACGGKSGGTTTGSTSGTASPASTASGAKKEKTELIIAMSEDVAGLDPFAQNTTIQNTYTSLMYDTLLKMDVETGNIGPWLAESYEMTSPTEYVFKLRKGVKFHDGTEMKAGDVKFSIERAAASAGMAPKVSKIERVEVVDDYTVRFILNAPSTNVLNILAFCGTSIMSEAWCKAHESQFANNGTGPYQFREWNSGDNLILDRFEDYWGEKPKMKTLKFVVMTEGTARTIALETGDIDVNSAVAAIDYDRIKNNAELALHSRVSGKVDYFGVNTSVEPTNNENVRKAIFYAINKQEIIDVLLEGRGEITNTILGPGQNYCDPAIKGYEYDLEKAKSLLAEAGYPNGFDLVMTVRTPRANTIAQVVQAQLGEVGINVSIESMESAAYMQYCKEGKLRANAETWQPATSDADNPLRSCLHSKSSGVNNRVYYNDPVYDEMVDRAVTLSDPAEAQKLYSEIQQYIVDHAILNPLFSEYWTIATNAHVKGVTIPACGDTLPYQYFYWEA